MSVRTVSHRVLHPSDRRLIPVPAADMTALVGREAMVTNEAGEYHLFSIEAATPLNSVLRPVTTGGRAFAANLATDAPVRLSTPVANGVIVVSAKVERWSAAHRMLMVGNASPDLVQRRSTFRVQVAMPVHIACARGRDVVVWTGQTLDVSEEGIAVTAKGSELASGELASVSLQLPSGALLVVARVVNPGDGNKAPSRFVISQIRPVDTTRFAAHLRRAELQLVRTLVGQRGP